MDFSQIRFLTSAAEAAGMPPDRGAEVAFAGRSNVGKSSALNRLVARRGLARASATPGRTQLVNFFALDPDASLRLVDLPGYGFARAPSDVLARWTALVEGYLSRRRSLAGLVLLADSRHAPKPADETLAEWARASALPLLVLLTKADKLGRAALARRLGEAQAGLGVGATVLAFSAVSGLGGEAARAWIFDRLGGKAG